MTPAVDTVLSDAAASFGASSDVAASGVCLSFGGLNVLTDVTFSILKGETYGIVGPNGAGKTSLLNCLSGNYIASSGEIRILDRPTSGLRPHRIVDLGLARTFQNVGAFRDMKALDVVLLGRHSHMRHSIGSYALGLPLFNGHEREQVERAMEALAFVGLDSIADRRLGELPYGAAKLVDLARTLAAEPKVLLLDEPTSGLSHVERSATQQLLERIRDERGVTQILVEHNMQLATALCHRILVLSGGTKLAEGSPSEALSKPEVITAFLGGRGISALS
jgi:branched-chain amino acid transport system ATP-binding protein